MLTHTEQKTKIAAMRRAKLEALETGTCLHPEAPKDCSGRPISAHTVQEALLRQIAENQHVYAIEPDEFNVSRHMALTGVREASTFPGFCSYHDTELFLPIEGNNAIKINEQHALLLAYRALSKEIYLKRAFKSADFLKYVPANLVTTQERQGQGNLPGEISKLLKIAEPLFHSMGAAVLRGDDRDTYFCAVTFNKLPDILCSGAFIASIDFHGKRLRKSPGQLDILTASLLPYGNCRGVAILAWYENSTASQNLIRSLLSLPTKRIPNAILKLVFRLIDNYYVRPSWWQGLECEKRELLINRPEDLLERFDLNPNRASYVNWGVGGVYRNFRL